MAKKKSKILFLEDEPDIVELYKIAFEEGGFEMESLTNGKDVLKRLQDFSSGKAEKPNAMILDILLPDISGMDILKEVRKNSVFNDIPVVMFTNYSSDKIREEIKGIKNTSYILKTDTAPDMLVAIVRGMIDVR